MWCCGLNQEGANGTESVAEVSTKQENVLYFKTQVSSLYAVNYWFPVGGITVQKTD